MQPQYSLIARDAEAEMLPFAQSRGHRRDRLFADGLGLLAGKMTRERIAGLPDDDWRKGSRALQEPQLS